MEDDRSSNENLAIIEQDYDYENEITTKPMKKMTKLDKSKSIETSTDIHRSDEFITKRYFMGSPTRFVVPFLANSILIWLSQQTNHHTSLG